MLDVTCQVDVVIGVGSITVRECLRLENQSVIRLQQLAGSDALVMVEGVTVASGAIAVTDDTAGVRISQVVPPTSAEARG